MHNLLLRLVHLWERRDTPQAKQLFRYTMVSVISTAVSFGVLLIVYGIFRAFSEVWSTVLANAVATIPSYYLNRSWVWGKNGRSHLTKEILPFWTMSALGIVVSIFGAALATHIGKTYNLAHLEQTVLVLAANVLSFAIFWVLKFIVFNRLFHVGHPVEELDDLVESLRSANTAVSEQTPVFDDAVTRVRPVDADAARKAQAHQDQLTKPPGSLGRLEAAGAQLAAIARSSPPPVPDPAVVAVFAGDHGVLAQGVSPWPAEVTAQMVANICAGGAAVNVLAAHVGAAVVVVDVGVAADVVDAPGLLRRKVSRGTADLSTTVAMSIGDARRALEVGATVATDAVASGGGRCLLTGDMGIGNTTPSAALIAAVTGQPARTVTGRGTGIDDARWEAKVAVVERALARHAAEPGGSGDPRDPGDPEDPLTVLASLGGLEIAALVGYLVAGSAMGVPVVIDGVIATSAAVVAAALVPEVGGYLVAGHRSSEPGASVALHHLGLEPLLDLELRLGEGTGACLALPILQAAAKVLRDMATFESAGVSDSQ